MDAISSLLQSSWAILSTADLPKEVGVGKPDSLYESLFDLPRTLDDDLILTEAEIGILSLTGLSIEGSILLDGCRVRADGGISLLETHISRMLDISNAEIKGSILVIDTIVDNEVIFREASVFGNAILLGSSLGRHLDASGMTMHGRTVFWNSSSNGLHIGDDAPRFVWKNGVDIRDRDTGWTFWRFARHVYEKIDDRRKADASFYYERSGRMKAGLRHEGFLGQAHGWLSYLFDSLVRIPVAYGTSFLRTITAWFVVIFAFAGMYWGAGLCPVFGGVLDASGATVTSFAKCTYFSIVTFTTLGYGDLHPTGAVAGLAASESIIGAILMALSILVVARRFMR